MGATVPNEEDHGCRVTTIWRDTQYGRSAAWLARVGWRVVICARKSVIGGQKSLAHL